HYVKAFRPGNVGSKENRAKIFLAFRLRAGSLIFPLEAAWQAELKSVLPEDYFEKPSSKTLQELKKFRTSIVTPSEFESVIADNNTLLQKLRQSALADIRELSFDEKLQTLEALKSAEATMAQLIVQSPVPEGLSPAELIEYRSALQGSAKDFADQSLSYGKLLENLRKELASNREEEALKATPPFNGSWDWPNRLLSKKDYRGLRSLIRKKS